MSRNQPGFGDWDAVGVQERFFLDRLPANGGRFWFPTGGMAAESGTIVLFQYTGVVVASAELLEIERYERPRVIEKTAFRGAYLFDPLSIRTFTPVEAAQLKKFWPKFVRFGHAKQSLAPAENYLKFKRSRKNVRRVGGLRR
jgi:hypothetical protein